MLSTFFTQFFSQCSVKMKKEYKKKQEKEKAINQVNLSENCDQSKGMNHELSLSKE